jgi:prepilin-type N-terminal cleavage/methylation domain-containing protein
MELIVKRAFTLIEIMITISLLAILFACDLTVTHSLSYLRRQHQVILATRQAENQLKQLQRIPFDQLPPQLLKADSSGWLQLGLADLDPGSLRIQVLEGRMDSVRLVEVKALEGRVRVAPGWAGRLLQVDYACYLSDRGETHRVGPEGQLQLENTPARVERIWAARGEQLTPFTDWSFQPAGGLRLGPTARNRVLMVDYRGRERCNRLSARFVDEQLRSQATASPFKLMRVQELYSGHERFAVTGLRVAP